MTGLPSGIDASARDEEPRPPTPGGTRLPGDGPARRRELRLLERWVPTFFAGRHVLEVGAGSGYWTRFIAPQTASLLATDPAPQVLSSAPQRVASRKVRYAQADAFALPAALGRFDAAFAGFWVSQVPRERLGAFFHSLHQRLEPGAKVLLLDHRLGAPHAGEPLERDEMGNTYLWRIGADGQRERVMRNFPRGEELLQRTAGFGGRPVLHQWAFFWALCYELGPGT